VNRESATRSTLHLDPSSVFPINENHSDIVKFKENDHNYTVVASKLLEICSHNSSNGSQPAE
jgi:hypothetical protein